ncbi:MAG: hypothetical protein WC846_01955 [Candidatus Gracilibacteria bacterium]|jgi:hypothetical protein
MSLKISSSAYYLKVGNRVIDKITSEYNPPRYWFRIKISASGKTHHQVIGSINSLFWRNYRLVKNFDPLTMLWLNEPLQSGGTGEHQSVQYFKPDISAGRAELAGLMHVKLPMKPVDPSLPLPAENISDADLPEVELDQSLNEPVHIRKRRAFPYGIYYIQVFVTDNEGNGAKETFKVWASRDAQKCKIRTARFYEKIMLRLKLLLPPL